MLKKWRTLLQEFLDAHQEEFSEEKISQKVSQIIYLDGEKVFEGLKDPENIESFENTAAEVNKYLDELIELNTFLHQLTQELRESYEQISQVEPNSENDKYLQVALKEHLSQVISTYGLVAIDQKFGLNNINRIREEITDTPKDPRFIYTADRIRTEFKAQQEKFGSIYKAIIQWRHDLITVSENYLNKIYNQGENIYPERSLFKKQLEDIEYQNLSKEDTQKAIQDAKDLQEPWEKQLDPLCVAGILKYIR